MSEIELRALLTQAGEILFVRERGSSATWGLPGGTLGEDADDVDAAMGTFLSEYGVASPDMAEDFLQTSYLPGENGHTVLNLYAPSELVGELVIPAGFESRWIRLEQIGALDVDPALREAILAVYGAGALDDDDSLFAQLQEDFGRALEIVDETPISGRPMAAAFAPFEAPAPAAGDRHAAGLDVMRTLGATNDPQAGFDRMRKTSPELAGDVVDFALGEVWSHPALDRRTRSLEVVAMLAAMGGKSGPLRSHLNGALNHGATPEQVVQTLRMVAVYAGFPAALEAWPLMEEVFRARGIERPGGAP